MFRLSDFPRFLIGCSLFVASAVASPDQVSEPTGASEAAVITATQEATPERPISLESPYVLTLKGEFSRKESADLRVALASWQAAAEVEATADPTSAGGERNVRPLVVVLEEYFGLAAGVAEALLLRDALQGWPGPLVVFAASDVVGSGTILLLSSDEVYLRDRVVVSLGEMAITEVMQARIRAGLPQVPHRLDLTRAFLQPDRSMEIEGLLDKNSGENLVLTGTEAAKRAEGVPLLATALHPDLESFLRDRFGADAANAATRLDPKARPSDAGASSGAGDAVEGPADVADTTKDSSRKSAETVSDGPRSVYVVPIEGPIADPQLYILRRAIRSAIENQIDTLVLEIDTYGGSAFTTIEMMEALERFQGTTIAYVNSKAISAGAFLSIVCDHIYFSPAGTMGSAELVSGDGGEIAPSMKAKFRSLVNARVRSATADYRYREDVMRAMAELEFELIIDGELLTEAGELMNITAQEAVREFGRPPQPLLADGIVSTVEELLADRFGADGYTVQAFELSWSESFAKWFGDYAGVLASLGLLLLFIEFKTPSFGVIGGVGIALLVAVFFSQYFAGLAGYEPLIFLGLGLLLLIAEIFLVPGIGFLAVGGVVSVLVGLVWMLANVWPSSTGGLPEVTGGDLGDGFTRVVVIMAMTLVGILIAAKLLPQTGWGRRFVMVGSAGDDVVAENLAASRSLIGRTGTVTRPLRPSGEVEVDGERYPASVPQGYLDVGDVIVVVQREAFTLVVQRAPEVATEETSIQQGNPPTP